MRCWPALCIASALGVLGFAGVVWAAWAACSSTLSLTLPTLFHGDMSGVRW